MLYFYKYPDRHLIQKLHEFIENFFEQMHIYNEKQFSPVLLDDDFRPIAEAYNNVLLIPLQEVFEEYKKLGKDE